MLYAIQVWLGDQNTIKQEVVIWIDNAEVLSRGKGSKFKDNIKGHMALDYDLWRVMKMLQKKITIPLRWEKSGLAYRDAGVCGWRDS